LEHATRLTDPELTEIADPCERTNRSLLTDVPGDNQVDLAGVREVDELLDRGAPLLVGARIIDDDVRVEGQLGEGWYRRSRSWNRATGGLRRLLIGAGSGYLSLEAVAWCQAAGVAVLVVDADSDVTLGPAGYGADDARLRRLQAAPPPGLGESIALTLLGDKLDGQAALARDVLARHDVADTIGTLAADLRAAPDVEVMRQLEASAAACYFDAWCNHPATSLSFTRRDRQQVPHHWVRVWGGGQGPADQIRPWALRARVVS
jgi:hypothetical protein